MFLLNIKLKLTWKLTVIKSSFIAIYSAFIFEDFNSSVSVTIHNYTCDHTNFVTMIHTVTSQSINLSFFITLYV
jgi:hypothetical protein